MDGAQEAGIGERAAKIMYPLFVGQVFAVIFTALTFVVVARLLKPTDFGIYVFAFGFAAFVNSFHAFGIGSYFSTRLAKHVYNKNDEGILRTLGSGYLIAFIASGLITILGVLLSGYVSSIYVNIGISQNTLILASLTIVVLVLSTIAMNALVGLSRSDLAAINNVSVDIIQLVLSILFTLKYGVDGAIAAMLIGYAFGALAGGYLVYRCASKYSRKLHVPTKVEIDEAIGYSFPLAANNFLNTGMNNFSILFLGLFITTSALGNYGAAIKGLALLTMIYSSFSTGLLPLFSTAASISSKEKINKTYNTIILLALVPMLPIMIYVGALAGPGLVLLVGRSYSTAPFYLSLIVAGSTIGLFGTYISNLLASGDHTKSVLKINMISAIVQFAFLIVLVPYAQIIGAIITIFFIGNIIEAIIYSREVSKVLGVKIDSARLYMLYLSIFALGLLLYGIAALISHLVVFSSADLVAVIQLLAGLIVALLAYPIILVVFRVLDEEHIIGMKHAVSKLGMLGNWLVFLFIYTEHVYKSLRRI